MKEEILNLIYEKEKVITDFDEKFVDRYNFLKEYQNTKYADQYKELVDYVKKYEQKIKIDKNNFSNAVAINYFKLMSYKDEYEVARLYSNNEFISKINNTFEGNFKINFHLAPPIFNKKDKVTGNVLKMHFGSWIMVLFKFIGIFKFLRGTYFDPFAYLDERKIERLLINDYKDRILEICSKLTKDNYTLAVEIASIPDQIRGFGYIKNRNIEIAKSCEDRLMSAFNG
jgi:indolepyruvate ferredoxin oxidoreductase